MQNASTLFPSDVRNLLPVRKCSGAKLAIMTRSYQMPSESEQVAYCTMNRKKTLCLWGAKSNFRPMIQCISSLVHPNRIDCDASVIRDLTILFIHLLVTVARLFRPDGVRSIVAESLLVKHQLLILNRSRKRASSLKPRDRIIAGLCAITCCQSENAPERNWR